MWTRHKKALTYTVAKKGHRNIEPFMFFNFTLTKFQSTMENFTIQLWWAIIIYCTQINLPYPFLNGILPFCFG